MSSPQNYHVIYSKNNYKLNVPVSIKERTKLYLQQSSQILGWFDENYEISDDKEDFIKIAEVHEKFRLSDLFENLTKADKRKYIKKYFIKFMSETPFYGKYYRERKHLDGNTSARNIMIGFKERNDAEDFE
jgi:hypothetical protein